MLKIREYRKAKDLEEAYQLNQKKSACVLGGMIWLKMGNRTVSTAIDLSDLGLNEIEETDEEFRIGAMTSLHALETHKGLDRYTNGAMRESLRHIVGIQFRNTATVGGSIFGRFGFSDVLTMFLALDSYVELYKGGVIPLEEFANMKQDRDILVRIIVKKHPIEIVYFSQRNTKTDFPVLTCAVSIQEENLVKAVIGATPSRAKVIYDRKKILQGFFSMTEDKQEEAARDFANYVEEQIKTGSNMRGLKEYRSHLVKVLTRRSIFKIQEDKKWR